MTSYGPYLRNPDVQRNAGYLGVDREWLVHRQNDANDPFRTFALRSAGPLRILLPGRYDVQLALFGVL